MNKMNVRVDKMRYQTNTVSYWLTMLSLILSLIAFFMSITFDSFIKGGIKIVPDIRLGIGIAIGIVLILATFLAAEKIKNYNYIWSIATIIIGIISFLRIFNLPLYYFSKNQLPQNRFTIIIIIYSVVSALQIIAGVIAFVKSRKLMKHLEELKN